MAWKQLNREKGGSSFTASSAFSRLAIVQLASGCADALITVALAKSLFFSVSVDTARWRIILSLIFTMLPFAIVAPFIGPFIDRSSRARKSVFMFAAVARAVTCFFISRHLKGLLLFPLVFTSLVLGRANSIAKAALVPTVVDRESQLVEANAKLTVITVIGGFMAALFGTALVSVTKDARWALWCSTILFSLAFVASWRVDSKREDTRGRMELAKGPPPESVEVAAFVITVMRAFVGYLAFLVAFAFRRQSRNPLAFGCVLLAGMAGSFVGAVVAPRIRRVIKEERIVDFSLGAVAIFSVVAFIVGGVPGAMLIAFVVSGAANASKMAFDSLVQRDAPQAQHGKSFARFETAFQSSWVVGALIPVVIPIRIHTGVLLLALASGISLITYVFGGLAFVRKVFRAIKSQISNYWAKLSTLSPPVEEEEKEN